jgi:hypothetical protein
MEIVLTETAYSREFSLLTQLPELFPSLRSEPPKRVNQQNDRLTDGCWLKLLWTVLHILNS